MATTREPESSAMRATVRRHAFNVDEYYKMAEAGIFHEEDRVELIEGDIIEMAPIGPSHSGSVNRLNRLFSRSLGDRAVVHVQNPLRPSEYSEPQPDLVLLRYRPDLYGTSHPTPEDTLLVVEAADTSLRYDRDVKVPLYARSGVPEVWLVDLNSGSITIYREPTPDGYRSTSTVSGDDQLAPQAFPETVLTARQILG